MDVIERLLIDDVSTIRADAQLYELMYRSADGWVLSSENEPTGGVVVALDWSRSRVVGLPVDAAQHWFAVRARNAFGVSVWSDSVGVEVPAYAQAGLVWLLPFGPFHRADGWGLLSALGEPAVGCFAGRPGCGWGGRAAGGAVGP